MVSGPQQASRPAPAGASSWNRVNDSDQVVVTRLVRARQVVDSVALSVVTVGGEGTAGQTTLTKSQVRTVEQSFCGIGGLGNNRFYEPGALGRQPNCGVVRSRNIEVSASICIFCDGRESQLRPLPPDVRQAESATEPNAGQTRTEPQRTIKGSLCSA
jgi:hypothetical protein